MSVCFGIVVYNGFAQPNAGIQPWLIGVPTVVPVEASGMLGTACQKTALSISDVSQNLLSIAIAFDRKTPDEYENVSFVGGGGGQYTMEMDGGTCNGMDVWHLNEMDAEALHRQC